MKKRRDGNGAELRKGVLFRKPAPLLYLLTILPKKAHDVNTFFDIFLCKNCLRKSTPFRKKSDGNVDHRSTFTST